MIDEQRSRSEPIETPSKRLARAMQDEVRKASLAERERAGALPFDDSTDGLPELPQEAEKL